jgi:hypothetical protein
MANIGSIVRVGCGLLMASTCTSAIAQNAGIFSGLPYAESEIRAKIAQYSVTAESSIDAAWKVPVNLAYQLAFRQILADAHVISTIGAADFNTIRGLPAPWDAGFLAADHAELSAICTDAKLVDSDEGIEKLAFRFDSSRQRRERNLDAVYSSALSQLSDETRKLIEAMIAEFATSKNIAYATFDMAGFARELPEAAKAILLQGCRNFAEQISSYTPQTVTFGDL